MEELYKQYQALYGGSGSPYAAMAGMGGMTGMGMSGGSSALGSLNEEDYINKLYGENLESEKELIQKNYTDNTDVLLSEQDRTQKQTEDYVQRTKVEAADNNMNTYNGAKLSLGAGQQAALTQENARQNNLNALNERQAQLEAEIDRQRQLLAGEYETAIKQAQAENDMAKAQALYEAARKEDQQLMDTKMKMIEMMSSYGDMEPAMLMGMLSGGVPSADIGNGTTSAEVLRYEDDIQKLYDSKNEAAQLGLRSDLETKLSDLLSEQEKMQKQTDEKLTQAYVDGLQGAKSYAEYQGSRGMGSGVYGQAQMAQDTELLDTLTDLRLVQMDTDAGYGQQRLDAHKDFSKNLQDSTAANNLERAVEMLEAAESVEEQQVAMEELMMQYMLMAAGSSGGGGGGGYSSSTRKKGKEEEVEPPASTIAESVKSKTTSGGGGKNLNATK